MPVGRQRFARAGAAVAVVALAMSLPLPAGTSPSPFPPLIELPADFGPEGIASGTGTTFYAGSLAAATRGQILAGDLRTGEFAELVAATGIPAIGMKHDARSNLLFVARGGSGTGAVYDAASGLSLVLARWRHQRGRGRDGRQRHPRGHGG